MTSGYNRSVRYFTLLLILGLLAAPASPIQTNPGQGSELTEILNRMAAHEERQKRNLIEYQVHRKFYAANPRFNKEAVLDVKTVFRQPNTFESEVLKSEGSTMIRERVFDKILEAEKEANSKKTKQEVGITPDNYKFTLIGQEDCSGRPCHILRIAPKQKSKYSIEGQIWVDSEDGAIVRLQGSPAKKPSFWTLSTKIERRYKRVDGVWLCEGMDSSSNIFVAGPSTLKVEYEYLSVETVGSIE